MFEAHEHFFIICDSTYACHQKSLNNEIQKKTYSGQKQVPLCMSITICTYDGHVFDILGPYLANLNSLRDPTGSCKLLAENGFMVFDRGFWDMKDDVELKKIKVLIPAWKGNIVSAYNRTSTRAKAVAKVRSEDLHGLMYCNYLGDGGSKTFKGILDCQPFNDFSVNKKECVGHVQKLTGRRLRTLTKILTGSVAEEN